MPDAASAIYPPELALTSRGTLQERFQCRGDGDVGGSVRSQHPRSERLGRGCGWASRSPSYAGLAGGASDPNVLAYYDVYHGSESYLSLASASHAPSRSALTRDGRSVSLGSAPGVQHCSDSYGSLASAVHTSSAAACRQPDGRAAGGGGAAAPPLWHGLVGNRVRGRWDAACAIPEAALHLSLFVATLYVLFRSWTEPLIARTVSGSFVHVFRADALDQPAMANGVGLNAQYSLLQLGLLAARGGLLNGCLSITFLVFMIVGPLLRTLTQIGVVLLPLPMPALRRLHRISRNISVFYALEVMVVVVPLLDMAVSDLANGMLTPSNLALCAPLNSHYGGPCLSLHVKKLGGYYYMAAAVFLYFLSCLLYTSPSPRD